MLTLQQLNNLQEAAKNAYKCEVATKVPCELTLAQWALESGWGAHSPGNNCFGIKGDTKSGQLLHTYEYFTPPERDLWLSKKQGRTATLQDATYNQKGQQRYRCQDWFAVFPSLTECFTVRALLFQRGLYRPHLVKFWDDGNFVTLVNGISPIYATDPDYNHKIMQIASLPEVQAAIKVVRA